MAISAKTEEFLLTLLWMADVASRPTYRNLNDSFEGWCHRQGYLRRLKHLERAQLIERPADSAIGKCICRLTESGRQALLAGSDHQSRWDRAWDGQWRMLLFDLPRKDPGLRRRLLRWLHDRKFGYLQNSVWISPDPLDGIKQIPGEWRRQLGEFVVMEGRPAAPFSDEQITLEAWNFDAINDACRLYLDFAKSWNAERGRPREWLGDDLAQAAARERELWANCVRLDPLLPASLCPKSYLGFRAVQARAQLVSQPG